MKEKLVSLAKSRYFIPTIMMMVSLSLVVYAVTSVHVSNTVTITSGASVQIIYQTTAFAGTTCPSTGYSTSPPGVAFIESAGGSNTTYLCIENIGSGSDSPTISITAGDPGTCGGPCFSVTPISLPTIPSGGFSSPTTLTISNHYSTAQAPIAITITVT